MPRTFAESRPPGHFKNRAGWTLRAVRADVEKKLARIVVLDGAALVTQEIKVIFVLAKPAVSNNSLSA